MLFQHCSECLTTPVFFLCQSQSKCVSIGFKPIDLPQLLFHSHHTDTETSDILGCYRRIVSIVGCFFFILRCVRTQTGFQNTRGLNVDKLRDSVKQKSIQATGATGETDTRRVTGIIRLKLYY